MRTYSIARTFRRPLIAGTLLAIIAFAALENRASAAPAIAISNQASSSGHPAGSQVFDSATLGYGVNPTGTITFKLYGPADPSCSGTPLFTTDTVVHGNGYHQSRAYVTNAAGTYRWTAKYNGDSDNDPTGTTACSDPAGAVIVDKRRPVLNASASGMSSIGTILNSATLSSASGPHGPTGTLTYRLYGPNDMTCGRGSIFTTSVPVRGVGTYPSPTFEPSLAGTYQWTVAYSGDVNNWWAGTTCTDPANNVRVQSVETDPDSPPVASVAVSTSPRAIRPAQQLTVSWSTIASPTSTDWVALYAVGGADHAVIAWKYTNGTVNGSATMTVPWGTPPGNYEVRLSANNSYQNLATSPGVTIIAP